VISTAGVVQWGPAVNSASGRDELRPRASVHGRLLADPGPPARAAQVLIAVQTAAQLALAVVGGTRSPVFARFALISTVLLLATVVMFLNWFHRCRLNAEVFAPGTHRYSAGFAVGAWFIPVAMWWIPRRIALDIRRAGSPVGGAWLIEAWWVAWLAKTVGGAVAAQLGARPYGYSLYDDVVGVVAAVLAVLMIQQVTAGQDAKVRAGEESLPAAPSSTP
jgi:hypothetical protein